MAKYNPKSLKAEEFINHEEILKTLEYAEEPVDIAEQFLKSQLLIFTV